MSDNDIAIQILRELAEHCCAVQVAFSDCGCVTVEYFDKDGVKVTGEDKDFYTAVRDAAERVSERMD